MSPSPCAPRANSLPTGGGGQVWKLGGKGVTQNAERSLLGPIWRMMTFTPEPLQSEQTADFPDFEPEPLHCPQRTCEDEETCLTNNREKKNTQKTHRKTGGLGGLAQPTDIFF